ncbi:acyl-CoA dehydrogenase family protein [Pseudomonas corrugata]|uniref:acyl-CoA dehydrogenase family protein n=1 Tax=Pseudomonas corrugata TaxID=47879 RepID=UPI0015863694|nr:acyl-CoA dehydrogenase family protein [Pseudomonas corrugata]MCI0996996.1 acyl-CoA dehydrogenase family protein [Pseudomonas corrugata]NUT64699.1 acyl-CoA dehydrogenase [Pseudomonas corrugata]
MSTKETPANNYNDADEPELIARARKLQPLLREFAPRHEQERRISPEIFQALAEAGFWAMASPRRWGGTGTSATTMARVGLELAKGDPSVGWVYTVLHGTTWVASLGPDELQEAIFSGEDHPTICGVASPPGIAEEVEGGYRVNGRWGYCSGSRNAQWGQFGCNIKKADGTVVPGGFAYLRMSDVSIEDTWFMTGMRGTGSETSVAKDVFVPSARFFKVAELGIGKHPEGKRHVGEPNDYWPFMPFLRATAFGMLVGVAQRILEQVTVAATKRPIVYTTYTRQSDSGAVQHNLGIAAAKIEAARIQVEYSTRQVDLAGLSRTPMTPAERAQSKGVGSLTVQMLSEAVESLMVLAGSGAFAEGNELSRLWRDFNVAARHTANLPYVGYEIFGKNLLGIEPNISPPDFI